MDSVPEASFALAPGERAFAVVGANAQAGVVVRRVVRESHPDSVCVIVGNYHGPRDTFYVQEIVPICRVLNDFGERIDMDSARRFLSENSAAGKHTLLIADYRVCMYQAALQPGPISSLRRMIEDWCREFFGKLDSHASLLVVYVADKRDDEYGPIGASTIARVTDTEVGPWLRTQQRLYFGLRRMIEANVTTVTPRNWNNVLWLQQGKCREVAVPQVDRPDWKRY